MSPERLQARQASAPRQLPPSLSRAPTAPCCCSGAEPRSGTRAGRCRGSAWPRSTAFGLRGAGIGHVERHLSGHARRCRGGLWQDDSMRLPRHQGINGPSPATDAAAALPKVHGVRHAGASGPSPVHRASRRLLASGSLKGLSRPGLLALGSGAGVEPLAAAHTTIFPCVRRGLGRAKWGWQGRPIWAIRVQPSAGLSTARACRPWHLEAGAVTIDMATEFWVLHNATVCNERGQAAPYISLGVLHNLGAQNL